MIPLGLVIESLVSVLLIMTIGYCMVLNSRLKRLRADEETMRATISELITATEIAERAILGLKSTANDCDQTLSHRLEQATTLCAQLNDQLSSGDAVVTRLSQITQAAQARQDLQSRQEIQTRQENLAQRPISEPAVHIPQTPAEKSMTPHMLLQAAEQSAHRLRAMRESNGVVS